MAAQQPRLFKSLAHKPLSSGSSQLKGTHVSRTLMDSTHIVASPSGRGPTTLKLLGRTGVPALVNQDARSSYGAPVSTPTFAALLLA